MLTRRRLLVGAITAFAAACGLGRDEQTAPEPPSEPAPEPEDLAPDPEPEPEPEPEDPPADPEVPADPAAYEASAQETHPNAKVAGAAIAQAIATYDPGDSASGVLDRATGGRGGSKDLDAARELFHEGWASRGEVVYPQFGGLTETHCSIMTVVAQTLTDEDGDERKVTRTIDVRLRIEGGVWVFDGLASGGGTPVERPDDLPEAAVAVLDDERIVLADSARWDIHRGHTVVPLLALMARLAEVTGGFEVNVLDTGHPTNVFGSDRVSDHSRGRALDIHAIAGELVIEGRSEGTATARAVDYLFGDDPGRPIIGAPWARDGFGGRSFTDPVHQDHIHVAVPRSADRGDPPDEELA